MTKNLKNVFDDVLFFSKISHELRTPIHGIRGLSEYLRDNWETLDDSKKKLYIEDISMAVSFLGDLVEKLFQLAHLNSNSNINCSFEKTDVVKVVETVVEQNNLFILDKNSLHLFSECDDKEIIVHADQFWINQLLSNLITNAMKHSGAKNIKVKIDSQKLAHEKKLVISVIDDGLGVPLNDLDTIFDPFKQGSNIDKSLRGSGLGLTICKEIVTAHGGAIWVKNNDTSGTNISFSLPERAVSL